MAVPSRQPVSEAVAGETEADDFVLEGAAAGTTSGPGGSPQLVAVPGGLPPLATLPGGAPPLESGAPANAGGGAPPLVALHTPAPSSTALPPPLYEAALRFFNGRERWVELHSRSACLGSRYWELNPVPDKSVEGIAPLEFFGPHPVWEGYAIPVQRKGKVNHFYCTFCKKVFSGRSTVAYSHLIRMKPKVCEISKDSQEVLVGMEKAFSERRSTIDLKKIRGNDGAITQEKMDVDNLMAKLMVELSHHQDSEIWDGTSRAAVMVGSLLEQAEQLLQLGFHPVRIAGGYEIASKIAFDHLHCISRRFELSEDNIERLIQTCMITLSHKIADHCRRALAEIAVKAVLAVADSQKNDANLNLVKVEGKAGGKLEDTQLIYGIVVDQYMSHPELPKIIVDAKIAILTCSFEPPNPQAKHKCEQEQEYFNEMLQKCQDVGATLIICKWGFGEKLNHLLMSRNLPAIGWVDSVDLALIAIATGGQIVPRFQELSAEKLGKAGLVTEKSSGTKDQMLIIEQCSNPRAVTILVRGGNEIMVEETRQILHDTLCVARNIIRYNSFFYGGASAGITCSSAVEAAADQYRGTEQHAIKSFAYGLDAISLPCAENNVLPSVGRQIGVKSRQVKEGNPHCASDCNFFHIYLKKQQEALETLIGKHQQQILHATCVVKMILKIGLNSDETNEGTEKAKAAVEAPKKGGRTQCSHGTKAAKKQ